MQEVSGSIPLCSTTTQRKTREISYNLETRKRRQLCFAIFAQRLLE